MKNKFMRRIMRRYLKKFGPQDSREFIALFAHAFKTTKQRISGNLSCLVCIDKTVSIQRDRPHSVIY